MCDCTLGGIAPTSPRVISLLVLDLTLRIHFKNKRNTLSMSLFALGDTPHTSLPYSSMGFTSVSKIYSINFGCRAPIFLNFLKIPKMAFRALSHKNLEFSLRMSPEEMVVGRMILPRYLYTSAFWITIPLNTIALLYFFPNTIFLVLMTVKHPWRVLITHQTDLLIIMISSVVCAFILDNTDTYIQK